MPLLLLVLSSILAEREGEIQFQNPQKMHSVGHDNRLKDPVSGTK